jgi:signal transduction histidine kinase
VTLTARFSWFFLTALAVGLAGFTAALNLLARSHLLQVQNERLDAAAATLTAAVEIKPTVVQWEPTERRLTLGVDPAPDQPRWIVRDEAERPIARSENLLTGPGNDVLERGLLAVEPGPVGEQVLRSFKGPDGDRWRVRVVLLRPTGGPGPSFPGRGTRHPQLTLAVALSTGPVEDALDALLDWSVAVSVGVWVLAAVGGRTLGRWALAPLTRMAGAARAMPATDLGRRLPAPGTRDELDDLSSAFNDLLARVQDAFARQERFTAEASHQLRTPLTALLGQADVALRRDRPAEEYRAVLERVVRQGNTLVRLVDALLTLARSEDGTVLPGRVPFDVGAWAAERIALAAGNARAADVRFDPPAEPVPAVGHPDLLGQAFDNLLDNAFKYGSPGTPIVVSVRSDSSAVVVGVTDQGPGIPAADLPRVFDPFYRSDDARRRGIGGMGLGLTVAKRTAEAAGGTIAVRSESGKGSTFELVLRRAEESVR